jgi:hypothetical protein
MHSNSGTSVPSRYRGPELLDFALRTLSSDRHPQRLLACVEPRETKRTSVLRTAGHRARGRPWAICSASRRASGMRSSSANAVSRPLPQPLHLHPRMVYQQQTREEPPREEPSREEPLREESPREEAAPPRVDKGKRRARSLEPLSERTPLLVPVHSS